MRGHRIEDTLIALMIIGKNMKNMEIKGMADFRLKHIGYIVKRITDSEKLFLSLGYKPSQMYDDNKGKKHIRFYQRGNETTIELVEPYPDNELMMQVLRRHGNSLYHLCYEVDHFEQAKTFLNSEGFILSYSTDNAIALGHKKMAFFESENLGLVEIVEANQ